MNKDIKIVIGDASYDHFSESLEKMINSEAKNGKMLKWSKTNLKKVINSKDSVLALADKEVVGFICLILYREYIEIGAMVVASEYRRRGIGTVLMKRSIDLAKEKYSNKNIILFANKISFQMSKQFNFVIANKENIGIKSWKACDVCSEYENFPNCHCQPMILMQ